MASVRSRQTARRIAVIFRDHDTTRDRIILEATRMFAGSGYAASSISDLADRVGINKAKVYRYFEAKSEILYAIIRASTLDAIERAEPAGKIGDPREALLHIIRSGILTASRDSDVYRVYVQESPYLQRILNPAQLDHIVALQRRYMTIVVEAVGRGAATGLFNVNPGETARVARMIVRLVSDPANIGDMNDLDALTATIARLCVA